MTAGEVQEMREVLAGKIAVPARDNAVLVNGTSGDGVPDEVGAAHRDGKKASHAEAVISSLSLEANTAYEAGLGSGNTDNNDTKMTQSDLTPVMAMIQDTEDPDIAHNLFSIEDLAAFEADLGIDNQNWEDLNGIGLEVVMPLDFVPDSIELGTSASDSTTGETPEGSYIM